MPMYNGRFFVYHGSNALFGELPEGSRFAICGSGDMAFRGKTPMKKVNGKACYYHSQGFWAETSFQYTARTEVHWTGRAGGAE